MTKNCSESCNLCGSKKIQIIGFFKKFSLFRCRNCELTFSKLPKEIDIKSLYNKDYFQKIHPNFFAECVNKATNIGKLKIYEKHFNILKKYKRQGELLDVGSGSGTFLNEARKRGFNVYGLDISEYVVGSSKKLYNLKNVYCGRFDRIKFKNGFFDVISMNDVLEHVEDPNEYINLSYKYLKKGGILIIYTVNEDSFMYKLANFIYKVSFGIIKKQMELSYPVHHLYHFKEKNLDRYLNKNKFKILEKRKTNMPFLTVEGGYVVKSILFFIYTLSYLFNSEFEILYICRKD